MEMRCEIVDGTAENAGPQTLQDARILEKLIQHLAPGEADWPHREPQIMLSAADRSVRYLLAPQSQMSLGPSKVRIIANSA